MPKRRKRPQRRRRPRSGTPFELAVAAIQRLLDPNAHVTHNQRLTDRLGHRRQFDVVIRGRLAGHDVLGVIECKDLGKPAGTPEVNAFADKSSNLRANIRVFASKRGFSKPALELAQYHGIIPISLVQQAPGEKGVAISVPAFAIVYEWTRFRIVFPSPLPRSIDLTTASSIEFKGRSVPEWGTRALLHFHDIQDTGTFRIQITFNQPATFCQGEREFNVPAFIIEAEREAKKKVRRMNWHGKAFFNWSDSTVVYSAGADFTSAWFRSDFSEWEDFDGEIPPLVPDSPFDIRVAIFRGPSLPEIAEKLTDLAQLELIKR